MLAALLASCGGGSAPVASQVAVAPVTVAPRWTGRSSAALTGATSGWVVGADPASIQAGGPNANLRPLWALYRVTGPTAADVTPAGITTRGGLTVSAPAPDVAWAGIGSYRQQLDGAVAVTTDGGRTWTDGVLPGLFDPVPDGLVATDAVHAWVLLGRGSTQSVVTTSDAGGSWLTVASSGAVLGADSSRCGLSGIGMSGRVLWLGTTCSGPGPALLFRSTPVGTGAPAAVGWTAVPVGPTLAPRAHARTTPPGTAQTGPDRALVTTSATLSVASISAAVGTGTAPPAVVGAVPISPVGAVSSAPVGAVSSTPVGAVWASLAAPFGAVLATSTSAPLAAAPPSTAAPAVVLSVTDDGGGSWEPASLPLPSAGRYGAVGVGTAGTIWVVGSDPSGPTLWVSPDAGAHWSSVHLPPPDTAAGLPAAGS
jgi:hypothetical protein